MKLTIAELMRLKQQEDFEVQTLVFSKEKFAAQTDATAWADDHGFKSDKVEETDQSWELLQFEADKCVIDTERNIDLDEGVQGRGCKVAESDVAAASMKAGKAKYLTAVVVKVGAVNKAARTVEGWASIEEVDRMGDLMLATAFEKFMDRFKANPVLCWCHNIFAPPIGSVIDIEIVPGKGLKFKAKFATTKFAQEIFQLFVEKVLRAFSVQFIPHETREPNAEELEKHGKTLKLTIPVAELLEISPVPVPAVAHALVGKAKSLDLNAWEAFILEALVGKDGEPDPDPDKTTKADPRAAFEGIKELAAQINDIADQGIEGLTEGGDEPPPDAPADEPPADEPVSEEEATSFSGLAKSIEATANEASGRLASSTDGPTDQNGG